MTKSAISPQQQKQINLAVNLLTAGEVVAFPTETVYGLGAEVTNPTAIKRIYEIKQRPTNHPLIVHIDDIAHLNYWAKDIPEIAWKLANQFWPGPLTLILQRNHRVSDLVTGGQDTVGIRVPAHPVALALLKSLGPDRALAAPSANRFGHISPTTAEHVQQEFGQQIKMILDGGACEVGLESTIIRVENETAQILRPGGISLSALGAVLNEPTIITSKKQTEIRTPGNLLSHYAPTTPLQIYNTENIWDHALAFASRGLRSIVIDRSQNQVSKPQHALIHNYTMPSDPVEYGRKLYAVLRKYDNNNFDQILVETPPDHSSWLAITDRLQRASHKVNHNYE